jgi:hypothetical protein
MESPDGNGICRTMFAATRTGGGRRKPSNGAAPDRTTDLPAKRLDLNRRQVTSPVRELQSRSPPLARLDFDEPGCPGRLPTGAGRDAYAAGGGA